jgi:hypothetical protein
LSVIDSRYRRILDVLWRVEIRLTRAEADEVPASGTQLGGQCKDGPGWGRLYGGHTF